MICVEENLETSNGIPKLILLVDKLYLNRRIPVAYYIDITSYENKPLILAEPCSIYFLFSDNTLTSLLSPRTLSIQLDNGSIF